MLRRVLRRRVIVGILAAMLLASVPGMGTVSADGPTPPMQPLVEKTTIEVSPYQQPASGSEYPDCPAHVTWSIYLGGGLGTWDLDVDYGDNSYGFAHGLSWPMLQFPHDFTGCQSRTFIQRWFATSAGGTDSMQTYVNYN